VGGLWEATECRGAESDLLDWFHKDWLNPDTWKPAVELVKEWQTLAGFLILVLGTAAGWVTGLFRWVASTFRGKAVALAGRPLRFVADEYQTLHTPVGANETTGTHVVGVWDVTNVSNNNFVLLKARLRGYPDQPNMVTGRDRNAAPYETKHVLAPHVMGRVRIDLVFCPPIHVPGKTLITDVIFTDNYGDEHTVPSVRFRRGDAPDQRYAPWPLQTNENTVINKKTVVSALQWLRERTRGSHH
jgi:hypothetical protein